MKKLVVVIRNDAPMLICGDSPTYRHIVIPLTKEQDEALEMLKVGVNCGQDIHEKISKCFIEEVGDV
jgi:hypothetical protein